MLRKQYVLKYISFDLYEGKVHFPIVFLFKNAPTNMLNSKC